MLKTIEWAWHLWKQARHIAQVEREMIAASKILTQKGWLLGSAKASRYETYRLEKDGHVIGVVPADLLPHALTRVGPLGIVETVARSGPEGLIRITTRA